MLYTRRPRSFRKVRLKHRHAVGKAGAGKKKEESNGGGTQGVGQTKNSLPKKSAFEERGRIKSLDLEIFLFRTAKLIKA